MKSILVLAVVAIAAGSSIAAHAVTMVATTTVDLRQLTYSASTTYGVQGSAFTPISVALAVGDIFDLTIKFGGTQTLTLTDPTSLWAFAYIASGQPASDFSATGTLSLLGTPLTSSVKTDTEGNAHFGQYFDSTDFVGGLPSSLTFSGLHYVGRVDAYLTPGVVVRTYNGPALYVQGSSALVLGTVPEPASWALLVAGFGLVGVVARRRARLTVSC